MRCGGKKSPPAGPQASAGGYLRCGVTGITQWIAFITESGHTSIPHGPIYLVPRNDDLMFVQNPNSSDALAQTAFADYDSLSNKYADHGIQSCPLSHRVSSAASVPDDDATIYSRYSIQTIDPHYMPILHYEKIPHWPQTDHTASSPSQNRSSVP